MPATSRINQKGAPGKKTQHGSSSPPKMKSQKLLMPNTLKGEPNRTKYRKKNGGPNRKLHTRPDIERDEAKREKEVAGDSNTAGTE